ncbi:hypothetical protein H2204_010760 [Knufia peltigerae]|uniref:Alpha/beta hydrolase fold-3 domain-containing protein n=1 Tax=Knufia peltigerae TaxID=1002370 RepID=A0AA38XVL4_9EURO|nr:hypothetical protein H2204_010760 [Knufia peltigerae]
MSTTDTIPNTVLASATDPNGTPQPPPSSSTTTRRTSQRRPLLTRFRFWIKIWLMKSMTTLLFKVMRLANRRKLRPFLPDYTKRYDVRPHLENRIFIPRNNTTTTTSNLSPQKYPLLITIHGGGFALCDPTIDDEINRHFADLHSFVVVSVDYQKSPAVYFPETVHDAGAVVSSVIEDPGLPVDASRGVTVAGFSAGGNLALAVAQLPDVKDKIRSVVPFYPVVDFTGLYKGEYRDRPAVTAPDGTSTTKPTPDMLKNLGPLFDWAYINPGTDLTDPLLSPVFATRSRLPQRIFFVTAEYDYLCHEAEVMARKLAGFDDYATITWTPGAGTGGRGSHWEQNGVRWRMVPDVTHSWTHMPLKDVEEEKKRRGHLVVLYKEVADWLKQ